MSEKKEHGFTSDLTYHLVKENTRFQDERDQALAKIAELEKKLAEREQPTNPTSPAPSSGRPFSIDQQSESGDGWKPKTVTFAELMD